VEAGLMELFHSEGGSLIDEKIRNYFIKSKHN